MLLKQDQKKLVIVDVIGVIVAAITMFFVTYAIIHAAGTTLVFWALSFIFAGFQMLGFIEGILEYVRISRIKKYSKDTVVLSAKKKFNI